MKVNREILNPLRAENIPLHQMSTDALISLARDKESSRRHELAVFVCTRADAYDEIGRPYPVWLSACLFELSDKLEEIAKEAARELRALRGH